ncbi:Ig-like domain-containing protein [Acerihabitans sp. KWT182]|uniref:Ig-like domain-containing protein n=1 Tax=Acerihabitans sp. KWT182 TaxID=3157919 RepID=A0AAU7QG61_9GAMM
MKILNCLKAIAGAIKALVKRIYIKPATATAVAAQQTPEVKPVNKITLAILKNSQPADGVSAILLQANVNDENNAPVAGAVVNFSATAGTLAQAQATTDANGQAIASLTNTAVGPVTLTAILADGTTASDSSPFFVAVLQAAAPIAPTPAALSPLGQAKAEFNKFVAFVEHGIEVLGADAEADLVTLKDKYL